MVYQQRQLGTAQASIRELPLLEGEEVEEQFVPYDGLVPETPWKGDLLVLTNQRVISFVENDGHKETLLAPLQELKGVSVKAYAKGLKNMSQGLMLILVGIVAYFIIGYILESVTIAAALGAAIMFVGVVFIARYFFWEQEGTITFQGGSWELRFPYKSNMASACVYKLVNRFFQLKLNTNNHPAAPSEPSMDYSPRPVFSPPPDSSYDI